MANFKNVNDEKLEGDFDSCLAKRLSCDLDKFLNDSKEDDFWFDQSTNLIYLLAKRNRDEAFVGKNCRLERGQKFRRSMYALLPIVLISVGVVFILSIIPKESATPSLPIAKVEKPIGREVDYEKFELQDDIGEATNTLATVRNCVVEKLLATSTEVDFFQMDMLKDLGNQSLSQSIDSDNTDSINQVVSFNEIASREFTEGESSSPREPLDPSNEITKFAMSLSPTLYLMNRIRENL